MTEVYNINWHFSIHRSIITLIEVVLLLDMENNIWGM